MSSRAASCNRIFWILIVVLTLSGSGAALAQSASAEKLPSAATAAVHPQPKVPDSSVAIIFGALLPKPHKYWHPPVVHFPIAFFCLEALLLLGFVFKPTPFLESASRFVLWLAAVSILPVLITGLHDGGVDLGKGNAILDGLSDRVQNFSHLDDSLSVHVLFIVIFVVLTAVRIAWRVFLDRSGKFATQKMGFSALTLIGLWMLLAAAQAGGSMSHQ